MDKVPPEVRRKTMRCIRSNDTLIEVNLRKALFSRGIRFRKNVKSLVGTPDIAIKKKRLVIFLDSCFWHICPQHFRKPKSNYSYWNKKIKLNQTRDQKVNTYYKDLNWKIIRCWEHELNSKDKVELVADKIKHILA